MKRSILALALALAASTTFVLPAWAGDKLTLDQVPAKVKETIEKHVQKGKIREIEREKKNGATVYEVDYTAADGKKFEMDIAEDGKLLKKEAD
jgi:uncharacterized membrane protein YkoI